MTTPWDGFIDSMEQRKRQIEAETKQIAEVLESYKVFREKYEALPPHLREVFASEQAVASGKTAPLQQDLAGKAALECAKIILTEWGAALHFSAIAKEAIRRGYVGRITGTQEEVESRTIQSFWAAMSRSDELESIGKGLYRMRGEVSEGSGPPSEHRTRQGNVKVQRESIAGICAHLIKTKGPRSLATLVQELHDAGMGQGSVNYSGVVNSALWRRQNDLFAKDADGLFHLQTTEVEFVG